MRQLRFSMAVAGALFLVAVMVSAPAGSLRAGSPDDCFSNDNERRIEGCTTILESGESDPALLSQAHAGRALALSLKGRYSDAMPDFDAAIRLDPGFSMALNNRAWTLMKLGQAEDAARDVERAIAAEPLSAHAFDTRAHIRQIQARKEAAFRDYEEAIRLGGRRFTRLYQCGLAAHGLYKGALDGVYSAATRNALRRCIESEACDPLPPDEECRQATS